MAICRIVRLLRQSLVIRRTKTHHTWNRRPATGRGFTLVELVVVILILGILGSIAAPKLINTTKLASKNAFATQLTAYVDAFDLYKAENGVYPSNAAAGTLPSGMEKYLNPAQFALETPLGGYWNYTNGGPNVYLGVEYLNGNGFPGIAVMLEVDQLLDDGNLGSGTITLINSTNKWLYWRFGKN